MYLLIISVTIVLFVTFLVLKAFEKKPARYGDRIIQNVPENKNRRNWIHLFVCWLVK